MKKLKINQNLKNPTANIYFNSIYKNTIEIAELQSNDICLDFGCGNRRLKQFLSKQRYIGYDLVKEFSDVIDYKKTRPTVIFALNILEHLTNEEIQEFTDWICQVKPRRIVVSLPCENFVNKTLNFITGRNYINRIEHINHWESVSRILIKKFYLLKYKRVWLMQWVSLWELR